MAREFKVDADCSAVVGYQINLLEAMLVEAKDNDAEVLPKWLRTGFPLGISQPIENTGIFPETDDVSASIKASQVIGRLLEDWDGAARNYESFYDAGDKAQAELDRLVEDERADKVSSWEEVVSMVGEDAKLTQLACIVKMKEGKEKVRLVVDMRRSGVNGQMQLLERVVLPRVPDVAKSCSELLKLALKSDLLEFMICDFSDAFYTLKLHESERKWVVCKGLDSHYYVMRCICFGLANGPLSWGRLASAAMRLAQSVCFGWEGRIQCYVDDPIIIACGTSCRHRTQTFLRSTLLWSCLGFKLAWHKACRGFSLTWIGVSLSLEGDKRRNLRVSLPEDKTCKILQAFEDIENCKGVVPIKLLEHVTGIMAWVANIIPIARPWTSMLWAAVHSAKLSSDTGPKRLGTRLRKGLAFKRQVDHAFMWLRHMMKAKGSFLGSSHVVPLSKLYRFRNDCPIVGVTTDACPTGLGGVLNVGGKPQAFFCLQITQATCNLFGGEATVGDPAFQTEWELLAIFIAICVFSRFLRGVRVQIFLQTDNTAAPQAALEFKASSPMLVSLIFQPSFSQGPSKT